MPGAACGPARAWTAAPAASSPSRSSPRWAARTRSPCTSAGALRNGLTPAEIGEILIHTAIYAGVPAANSAVAIANEVIAAESEPGGLVDPAGPTQTGDLPD